ncbi:MAG: hypothetical protein UT33_C0011G0068 [Candidatus Peregrinibacteria bacterium GW2011_GWC2_39_14]|nr:MAG: hypothetical protein UT33_C0011G0068 [Candidatus Peregrinibacteria bacterium GW2011_GWC2_39_14]
MNNHEEKLDKKLENKYKRRDEKRKTKMVVTGKSVFTLQRLVNTPKKHSK